MRISQSLRLQDLFSIDELGALLQRFMSPLKASSMIWDERGKLVFCDTTTPFCQKVYKLVKERCEADCRQRFEMALKRRLPFLHTCFSGKLTYTIPLKAKLNKREEVFIGVAGGCQGFANLNKTRHFLKKISQEKGISFDELWPSVLRDFQYGCSPIEDEPLILNSYRNAMLKFQAKLFLRAFQRRLFLKSHPLEPKLMKVLNACEEIAAGSYKKNWCANCNLKPIWEAINDIGDKIKFFVDHIGGKQISLNFKDSLTTAYNRSILKELEAHWTSFPTTVIFIDFNNLKRINDTYGHEAGDKALQLLVKAINNSVRQSDYIIRYGGDEFVILLTSFETDEVERIIQRIKQHLANYQKTDKLPFNLDFSYGISVWKSPLTLLSSVIKKADHQMYCMKKASKPS